MDTNEQSDGDLIKSYLNGEENSLTLLINRHLKAVYNFVYRLTYNKENAEDITGETFFKVWKNLKKFRQSENFKTWIFTIARNSTIDLLRKKKEYVFSDFEGQDGGNYIADTLTDPEPLADVLVEQLEKTKEIEELLSKISPVHREVLILRYNEELTFEEIGKVLKKPLDTVKSQHRRALISLRKLINEKK
jgi:RNA polymerase sigma factor (sigma-70 family)